MVLHHRRRSVVVVNPTVANGVIYIGSGDDSVYALKAATEANGCGPTTPAAKVFSSPTVADRVVYVGSGDGQDVRVRAMMPLVVRRNFVRPRSQGVAQHRPQVPSGVRHHRQRFVAFL